MIKEIVKILPKGMLIVFGIFLVFLSMWLPMYIEQSREHGGEGVSAYFEPGPESLREAMGFLITAFSILSAMVAAFIVLPFSKTKSTGPITLSIITLIVFSIGIVWSLYISLMRPLTGTLPSPLDVYLSLGLLLGGLGLSMFTLALGIKFPKNKKETGS